MLVIFLKKIAYVTVIKTQSVIFPHLPSTHCLCWR